MDNAPLLLRRLFDAAVAACHPARVVAPALPARPSGRVIVIGAGKASAAMAAAVEQVWGPPLSGLVVTRYGHGAATTFVEVIEAGHPLPDDAGADAARRALSLVSGLSPDDFVLVLLSGGGSALWSAPLAPMTLAEKQSVTRALVLSGAPIGDINCVRKHLSAIKGGRLASAAFPARVLALAISDVAGDDPSVIASGPCTGDATTQSDARAVLAKYAIEVPPSAMAVLTTPGLESIKPFDARLAHSTCRVVAGAFDALTAAEGEALRLGWETQLVGVNIEGDAREAGRAHAEIALKATRGARPLVLLSGGELTLEVRGTGAGGPNREFLLALMQALDGASHVWALAGDTDGIDGNDACAGAWFGPETPLRARQMGLDPQAFASRNDSGGFFAALGQELVTGATRTNVNDFRAILIAPGV